MSINGIPFRFRRMSFVNCAMHGFPYFLPRRKNSNEVCEIHSLMVISFQRATAQSYSLRIRGLGERERRGRGKVRNSEKLDLEL